MMGGVIFNDLFAAAHMVTKLMALPIVPGACEFMDDKALTLLREHANFALDTSAQACILLTVDGTPATCEQAIADINQITQCAERISFKSATTLQENKQLWEARKALSPALKKIAPKKINEDIVVPISELAPLFKGLTAISQESKIPIVNFGHAGNGNIHVNLLFDPNNKQQNAQALPALNKVFDLVLKLGGTLSGEHGVGLAKKEYLSKELTPEVITLMKNIKKQFDPQGILNPGKIFD